MGERRDVRPSHADDAHKCGSNLTSSIALIAN